MGGSKDKRTWILRSIIETVPETGLHSNLPSIKRPVKLVLFPVDKPKDRYCYLRAIQRACGCYLPCSQAVSTILFALVFETLHVNWVVEFVLGIGWLIFYVSIGATGYGRNRLTFTTDHESLP